MTRITKIELNTDTNEFTVEYNDGKIKRTVTRLTQAMKVFARENLMDIVGDTSSVMDALTGFLGAGRL
jgi:hypothetical protein